MVDYTLALETLENKIYDLITEVTGLPCYWFGDNLTKKLDPQFLLLHVTNMVEMGIGDDLGYTEDTDSRKITAKEWEVYVDIDCRRGRYTQTQLAKILHAFQKHTAIYERYFPLQDFAFRRVLTSISQNVVPINKEVMEERSRTTLVFSMVVEDIDPISDGAIEHIQINQMEIYTSETDKVVSTFTIDYP